MKTRFATFIKRCVATRNVEYGCCTDHIHSTPRPFHDEFVGGRLGQSVRQQRARQKWANRTPGVIYTEADGSFSVLGEDGVVQNTRMGYYRPGQYNPSNPCMTEEEFYGTSGDPFHQRHATISESESEPDSDSESCYTRPATNGAARGGNFHRSADSGARYQDSRSAPYRNFQRPASSSPRYQDGNFQRSADSGARYQDKKRAENGNFQRSASSSPRYQDGNFQRSADSGPQYQDSSTSQRPGGYSSYWEYARSEGTARRYGGHDAGRRTAADPFGDQFGPDTSNYRASYDDYLNAYFNRNKDNGSRTQHRSGFNQRDGSDPKYTEPQREPYRNPGRSNVYSEPQREPYRNPGRSNAYSEPQREPYRGPGRSYGEPQREPYRDPGRPYSEPQREPYRDADRSTPKDSNYKQQGYAKTPPKSDPGPSAEAPPPRPPQTSAAGISAALATLKLPATGQVPPLEELKKAYRAAALRCHPDRPHNHKRQAEATKEFQQVKDALELLTQSLK